MGAHRQWTPAHPIRFNSGARNALCFHLFVSAFFFSLSGWFFMRECANATTSPFWCVEMSSNLFRYRAGVHALSRKWSNFYDKIRPETTCGMAKVLSSNWFDHLSVKDSVGVSYKFETSFFFPNHEEVHNELTMRWALCIWDLQGTSEWHFWPEVLTIGNSQKPT